MLWLGTHYGFPISTTRCGQRRSAGAATRRFSAIRWASLATSSSLVLTLPAAASSQPGCYYPVRWISRPRSMETGGNGRPFTIVELSDLHCGQQFFLPDLLER